MAMGALPAIDYLYDPVMSIGRAMGGYTLGSLSSLGVDANGEIYLLDIGNGSIFKTTRGR
jgi:hypothetical protein